MKKVSVSQAFFKMLPLMAKVSTPTFLLWQGVAVAQALSHGMTVPATQYFFDRAVDFAGQQTGLPAVFWGLSVLGLIHTAKHVLNGVLNFTVLMYYRRIEGALSAGLHNKISKIAPVCFEDTQFLDGLNKALQGKTEAVWFAGSILASLNFYLPFFIFMGAYLFLVKPLLTVSLLLVFVPTLLTQVLRTKVFAKAEDKAAPVRRQADYYENCMVGREYFKETRMLGAFTYFQQLFRDSLVLLNKLAFRAAVKADMAELGMKLLSLSGYVGIVLLLFDALMMGEIGVGVFAAVFGAVDQMFSTMEELICYNFGASARSFGKVQNYFYFMKLTEQNEAAENAEYDMVDTDIIFQDVSFSYPGTGLKAIDKVSFTIKNNETVAIVGENGSGKSTLVRLLSGLYLADEGKVYYGETDVGKIPIAQRYHNTSAVFQNFQRYQMTLRENIIIGDVQKAAEDEELNQICRQAGINIQSDNLVHGYETMLSREFDGIDLSGGQWQRVAIARSFYRPHRIILLDEPTAAIDPLEETSIYNRFAKIVRNKTAVIVTHRLGSARMADRILVMKEGRLIEQGTHTGLLHAGGEYARLYHIQKQWYDSNICPMD